MAYESSIPQDSSAERRETWRMSGDLFDEDEVNSDRAKIGHRLGRAGVKGYSDGASRSRENPMSADELIARTNEEMRQFGRTDERIAHQTGVPRSASASPRPERPRRRPRQVEDTDNFYDDPLGRSRGSGTIG